MRSDHSALSEPEVNQSPSTCTLPGAPPSATLAKTIQDSAAETKSRLVVTSSAGRSPIWRPKMPAIRKPSSGKKTIAAYMPAQPFIMLMSSTAIEPRLR